MKKSLILSVLLLVFVVSAVWADALGGVIPVVAAPSSSVGASATGFHVGPCCGSSSYNYSDVDTVAQKRAGLALSRARRAQATADRAEQQAKTNAARLEEQAKYTHETRDYATTLWRHLWGDQGAPDTVRENVRKGGGLWRMLNSTAGKVNSHRVWLWILSAFVAGILAYLIWRRPGTVSRQDLDALRTEVQGQINTAADAICGEETNRDNELRTWHTDQESAQDNRIENQIASAITGLEGKIGDQVASAVQAAFAARDKKKVTIDAPEDPAETSGTEEIPTPPEGLGPSEDEAGTDNSGGMPHIAAPNDNT